MDQIGMTAVNFLSYLSLAKAKGMQKDNFRLFLTHVSLYYITRFLLFYQEQPDNVPSYIAYGTLCIKPVILYVQVRTVMCIACVQIIKNFCICYYVVFFKLDGP